MSGELKPFASTEEAWFWAIAALRARREERRAYNAAVVRPCDPDDVIRAVDRLWRCGELVSAHIRVLRVWGERGQPPDARNGLEVWDDAMAKIGPELRRKEIVT